MEGVSRRQFLKLAAVTGLTASLGGCGLFKPARPWAEHCPKPGIGKESGYDYIVVGSGAGGGPLAANLARAGYNVLLMEAGSDHEDENYSIPVLHPLATEDVDMQWNYFVKHYTSEEDQRKDSKFFEGPQGQGIWYPRAGTLGGCTAHNAMITIYPHPDDWENIAAITGDDSWKDHNMRKYFERVENCQYLGSWAELLNLGEHGFDGWLPVSRLDTNIDLKKSADPQLARIGVSAVSTVIHDYDVEKVLARIPNKLWGLLFETKDVNDIRSVEERPDGVYLPPLAIKDGKRASTREYIRNTQSLCGNQLTVKTNVLVTRVLFDDDNTARGVEYLEGAHLYRADPKSGSGAGSTTTPQQIMAKREIILSGGAFNTPQLLMLSGIGPKEELQKHGIPVRVDLPGVGKNLQDRYEVGIVSELKENLAILEGATFSAQETDPFYQEWKNQGSGLYATNGIVIGIQKRSKHAKVGDPDLYIFGLPGIFKGYEPGYTKTLRDPEKYQTKKHFTWLILKAHARNTGGGVTLRSGDPLDVPEINFRYFQEGNDPNKGQEDLDAVVEGVEFVRKIMATSLTEPIVEKEAWPGKDVRNEGMNANLSEWITHEAWGHHASCTCKIGKADDAMAVLDGNFRVYGTKRLRVVDASVFPRIPGFFIVASVYMISEKASDVILADAKTT